MLISSDLLRIPFTPDLTRAGIEYACRSLPHTYDRMGGSDLNRLRRIVTGKAVELAFRKRLDEIGAAHDTGGETHFTDPDHYDIAVNGRRCDLKSSLLYRKDLLYNLARDPSTPLRMSALVPCDQADSAHGSETDLYLFAFAAARLVVRPDELEGALAAGRPACLISPLPPRWARPTPWASLGALALKNETGPPLQVELGGETAEREFRIERYFLPPGRRVPVRGEFNSLAYLQALRLPRGRVGLSSPRVEVAVIPSEAWGNIWVYGIEIVLSGWMERAEFVRRARRLPAGSRVLQYPRTQTANLALPVSELRPMNELLLV